MAHPQVGLFALGTTAHAYLEFDLTATSAVGPAVDPAAHRASAQVVAAAADIATAHDSTTGVNLVVGFRPELWASLHPREAPRVSSFGAPIVGPDGFTMPATQHDVFFWLATSARDHAFDLTADIAVTLGELVTLADETHGWPYQHHRDLTGFIDGTENPTAAEAAGLIVVPDHEPGAGGSVLLAQRWVHDYAAWAALPVADQERVMGRSKADGVELEDRPHSSHAARTDQDEFGTIFRRNTAYGTLRDHGTMFVGFSATQEPLQNMLRSMAGIDSPRDALTRYAAPATGSFYFVPSFDDLVDSTTV